LTASERHESSDFGDTRFSRACGQGNDQVIAKVRRAVCGGDLRGPKLYFGDFAREKLAYEQTPETFVGMRTCWSYLWKGFVEAA